jgi:hypothetical protein
MQFLKKINTSLGETKFVDHLENDYIQKNKLIFNGKINILSIEAPLFVGEVNTIGQL